MTCQYKYPSPLTLPHFPFLIPLLGIGSIARNISTLTSTQGIDGIGTFTITTTTNITTTFHHRSLLVICTVVISQQKATYANLDTYPTMLKNAASKVLLRE